MCGRYTLGDPSLLKRRFGLEEFAETTITPRFNVAPSQDIPIVVQQTDGKRELRMAKWGFVPFFMEGKKTARDADGKKKSSRPPVQRASIGPALAFLRRLAVRRFTLQPHPAAKASSSKA